MRSAFPGSPRRGTGFQLLCKSLRPLCPCGFQPVRPPCDTAWRGRAARGAKRGRVVVLGKRGAPGEKGMWEGQGQGRYNCTHVGTALRLEGSRNHPIEVPVPSCWGHRCHCGLLPGAAQTLAVSTDALTAPLTATESTSLSHFPPYPWPDSHPASSLLLSVTQSMTRISCSACCSSPISLVPVDTSAGRGPGLSLLAFRADR